MDYILNSDFITAIYQYILLKMLPLKYNCIFLTYFIFEKNTFYSMNT